MFTEWITRRRLHSLNGQMLTLEMESSLIHQSAEFDNLNIDIKTDLLQTI